MNNKRRRFAQNFIEFNANCSFVFGSGWCFFVLFCKFHKRSGKNIKRPQLSIEIFEVPVWFQFYLFRFFWLICSRQQFERPKPSAINLNIFVSPLTLSNAYVACGDERHAHLMIDQIKLHFFIVSNNSIYKQCFDLGSVIIVNRWTWTYSFTPHFLNTREHSHNLNLV